MNLALYLLSTGAHGEPDMGMFEWLVSTNVFNILLAAFILGFLIKKFNLLGLFDQQQEKIRRDVEKVEQQKLDALKELETVKTRTANLSAEVDALMNEAKTSAESLSKQIIADAKAQSEKIVAASHKRVEMEQRSAMKSLEERLLNDAVADAEQQLNQLPADDKKRSVDAFIEALPQLNV